MDKRWLNLFFGQVRIEVRGRRAESFMNRCIEHGISITNISRTGEQSIVCTVQSEDVRKLRPLLRESDCKLHIVGRKGLPFFIKRMSFKKGFIAGLILFASLLFVLSNMLWSIEIKGAEPETEHEIRQLLDKMGVERGKFQFSLPSKENMQHAITDRIDDVAWVGVSLNGTTYKFNVLEKEIPEEEEALTPRNLVAGKEAVIHNIYVEQGAAKVQPDDYVQKGDVLISGIIGEDKKHRKVVPAKGKVWGETWYESEITVPLVTELKTYTGKNYTKHKLKVFGFSIPIWGFSEPDFKKYDIKTKSTPVKFLGWTLPISYETQTYLQTDIAKRKFNKKQALAEAKRLGKKDLRKKLDKKDKIKSQKVLRKSVENGKVKVMMYYTVIEEITVEQPLINTKETE
ncbi:MAG TPA: sporulation protein YqfD [Bacillales bacterium]